MQLAFLIAQAKVNTFAKQTKPSLPPKPQEGAKTRTEGGGKKNGAEATSGNDGNARKSGAEAKGGADGGTGRKPQLIRRESVSKTGNGGSKAAKTGENGPSASNKALNDSRSSVNNNSNNNVDKNSVNSSSNAVNTEKTTKSVTNPDPTNDNRQTAAKTEKAPATDAAPNSEPGSQTDLPKVPAATPVKETSTIEAVMDDFVKGAKDKITPMVDGRVLSATSVSNAINRMNDTVLSTNTLMKEQNFAKISPAASAIISMSNAAHQAAKTYDSRNLTASSENEQKDKTPSKVTEGPVRGKTEFVRLGHTVTNLNRFPYF